MDADFNLAPNGMVTEKWPCRMIARALVAFGIKRVVTSPGSRNAPLIMAVERTGELEVSSVIDERSAAFVALGMAVASGEPVAIICTSGTALLNYAPAVAEAYYRKVPLIVISADRPLAWIDQDDSQTIRQCGALANIVKGTWNVPGEAAGDEERWFVNRQLNDALLAATTGRKGPVHINVPLSAPLTRQLPAASVDDTFRKIDIMRVPDILPNEEARKLAAELSGRNIMIVAGFGAPDVKVSGARGILASLPNVAIIAEPMANIKASGLHNPDYRVLCAADAGVNANRYIPDVLITFGGALVSGKLKQYLRKAAIKEHWHVGLNDSTIDCFCHLSRRVEIPAEGFFPKLATSLRYIHLKKGGVVSTYAADWNALYESTSPRSFPDDWCALSAVETLLRKVPAKWNLQLSNGMSVRYAGACGANGFHRIDCNRGVSGIDGSVSTALGASLPYPHPTMLVTGDMSMQYDLAALSSTLVSPKLKIVVLNNGGGGIFRFIAPTASLPEMPQLLNGTLKLPLKELAEAYNFAYSRADSHRELHNAIKSMIAETDRPVLLEIITDGSVDAELMREYLGITN